MRIALYQMHIAWEDKAANIEKLEEQLRTMAEKKIEVLLLPEMSFTGFSMNTDKTGEDTEETPEQKPTPIPEQEQTQTPEQKPTPIPEQEQTPIPEQKPTPTLEQIQSLATKYGMAIGFGWVKKCGEKCENHYTIVDRTGACLSDYAKLHPFSYSGENLKFQGGEKLTTFLLGNVPCSTFICYDLRFPEIFQIASKTAHAVILPANWPSGRNRHWKTLLQARAIENQIYILAVNCVGRIGDLYYSGDSCVINPDGEIEEMLSDEEGVIIYDLADNVMEYRNDFPVKKDRREDLYPGL